MEQVTSDVTQLHYHIYQAESYLTGKAGHLVTLGIYQSSSNHTKGTVRAAADYVGYLHTCTCATMHSLTTSW